MGRKYYIIAGEASGDSYGSSLVESMLKIDADIRFKGFGGDKMKKSGVDISIGIDKLAVIGFLEVLVNLRRILSYFRKAKSEILQFQPDALILIDYPGFNLRMAEWAHKRGMKVYYYIAPQVWAWGIGRIPKIRSFIDRLFVILPFEESFFKLHNVNSEYVGNPLMEEIDSFIPDKTFLSENNIDVNKKKIAFFPGSRKAEILKHIEPVLPVIENNPDMIFLVAARSGQDTKELKSLYRQPNVRIIFDKSYDILHNSDAGIIKSGTSTLEALVFNVPLVVIYKTSFISQLIIKHLVNDIKFVSLINLIHNKEVVKELLQYKVTPQNISAELQKVLDSKTREFILKDYSLIRAILIKDKYTSKVVAEKIISDI